MPFLQPIYKLSTNYSQLDHVTILSAFTRYPDEAALIGRMLAGYADLEIGLMHCAKQVRGDLDLALKTMFNGRGNSQRIDLAVAIAKRPYDELELGHEFDSAIAAMRYCLRIRNLYAHCTWWADTTGELAFANLEDLAKLNVVVNENDLHNLTVNHVNVTHLQAQFNYFEYTDDLLMGVLQEGNRKSGKQDIPSVVVPAALATPPLKM